MIHKLILLRHGESVWNKENKFTGWTDVDLSENGITEAKQAGYFLRQAGLKFDVSFTSVLKRSIKTQYYLADKMNLLSEPVIKSWRLNERHYGALQGLNKAETAQKYGDEQVKIWRRSFDVVPPLLDANDPRSPLHDPLYALVAPEALPLGESLELTIRRVLPLWEDEIAASLLQGNIVLVVAHGNSLRALIKHLDNISDADIVNLEIPTGKPLVYELDEDLHSIKHYYLE